MSDITKIPDPSKLVKRTIGDEGQIWCGFEPEYVDLLIETINYRLNTATNLFYIDRVNLQHILGTLYRERAKFRIHEGMKNNKG